MSTFFPTIGLEIHTELKTRTKMFCGCLNDPDEKHPNINVCPICLGHPGTLPVINKKAVEAVLKLGLALGGEIPKTSKFDRKNYFYPDLPKGYQISQYDQPLVIAGELNNIRIRRIHLEEDTARLVHSADGKSSLVDFNRSGVPLMELVTEPDIKSGQEAVAFAKELRLILRYLEISEADMEKGEMRVEANISLSQTPNLKSQNLGTKVEIKNLNSFRAVEEAIDYEIKRQTEILEKGEKVKHETRGWDDFNKKTKHQRLKEEAHDYRYFPEPDLPPLEISKFPLTELKAEIPELPAQKRERFVKEYNLAPNQLEILIDDRTLAQYFEETVSELLEETPDVDQNKNIQLLVNYLTSDVKGLMNEQGGTIGELKITPENFSDLVVLIIKKEITSRIAKDVLKEMSLTGLDPREIIKEKELSQIFEGEIIAKALQEIIVENRQAVEDYKNGKTAALQFLIGQTMKKLKGRSRPDVLEEKLKALLDKK